MKKRICILGATGSVGTQSLELLHMRQDAYEVCALSCGQNIEMLRDQINAFPSVRAVAVHDEHQAAKLETMLQNYTPSVAVFSGIDASSKLLKAMAPDVVVCALVGAAGLESFFASLDLGARVLLANKEALVLGGEFFIPRMQKSGASIVPLDSEHSAAFAMLQRPDIKKYPLSYPRGLKKLVLTASGGPFWTKNTEDFHTITPQEAIKHPNWSMGAKISVDSATFMNKALELIEAHYLFGLPPEKLDVWVHRQSQVHALWVGSNGMVQAGMNAPSMKIHIAHALDFDAQFHVAPQDEASHNHEAFDFSMPASLTFEAIKAPFDRSVSLAKKVIAEKGATPIYFNALNEACVAAFLKGRINFLNIIDYVEQGLDALMHQAPQSLEEVLLLDQKARAYIDALLSKGGNA